MQMVSVQNHLQTVKDDIIRSVMEVQNNANFRTQALGPTVNTDVNGEEEGDNAHPKRDGRVASVLEVSGHMYKLSLLF